MTDIDTTKSAATPRVRAPKAAAATSPAPSIPAKTASKSDTVVKLLLRAKGATPIELIAATDWQPHSLRAFLSGLRKKGRVIVREERKGGSSAYRIVVGQEGTASAPGAGPPPEAASINAGSTGTALNEAPCGAATIGQAASTGGEA